MFRRSGVVAAARGRREADLRRGREAGPRAAARERQRRRGARAAARARSRAPRRCSPTSASSRTRPPRSSAAERDEARALPARARCDRRLTPPSAGSSRSRPGRRTGSGPSGCARCSSCLGNPQRSFDAVHVVGTKGKSTAARRIARTVGGPSYTSPHVAGWHERLDTDPDGFERAVERVRDAAVEVGATQFEAVTAAAFADFAARGATVGRRRGRARRPPRRDEHDRCPRRAADERRARAHRRARRSTREEIAAREARGRRRRARPCVLPDEEFAHLVAGELSDRRRRRGGRGVPRRSAPAGRGKPPGPARDPRRRGPRRRPHARGGRLAARAASRARRLRRRRVDPRRQGRRRRSSTGLARAGRTLVATALDEPAGPARGGARRPRAARGSTPSRPCPIPAAALARARASAGRVLVTGSLYLLADLARDRVKSVR